MNWTELLTQIFELCIVPLLGILTSFLVMLIKSKIKEIQNKIEGDLDDKYLTMLSDTITACVLATNQTYVDSLKDKNLFDTKGQKEALNRTYKAVISILSKDATKYLTEAYGDLQKFIMEKIEAEVQVNKKG